MTPGFPSIAELHQLAGALTPLRNFAMKRLTAGPANGGTPVRGYLTLMEDAGRLNVSSDGEAAVAFRRRFNGYYAVRRNEAWRRIFYRQFELGKAYVGPPEVLFKDVLGKIHRATQRVEASFASKLVASIHPKSPVIDSVVRTFLTEHLEASPDPKGMQGALNFYGWLNQVMAELSTTQQAADWFAEFNERFSDEPGAAEITDMKKLDFLIWGGARR